MELHVNTLLHAFDDAGVEVAKNSPRRAGEPQR
jgi:hypothetical protein